MANKVIIIKENGEQIFNPDKIAGLDLVISGDNNVIVIHEPYTFVNSRFLLTGDIEITIEPGIVAGSGFLIKKIRNIVPNKLVIGKHFQCGSGCTIDLTDAGDVFIGDDAKWSWNIYVKSDDTHPVFDVDTKQCVNKSTSVVIGRHVWIGMNATILKNSEIKPESVVGACSVVAKKFDEGNVVVAGNPARICKRNINWAHGAIEHYIQRLKHD